MELVRRAPDIQQKILEFTPTVAVRGRAISEVWGAKSR
jgi:hypothetical protein